MNNNFSNLTRAEIQEKTKRRREELNNKLYLGQIIEQEKPLFKSNNLIIAPVGSGKSHLIENTLIPQGFNGKALYLTSNTALKDSVCPERNEDRELNTKEGKYLGFFTTSNKAKFGKVDYSVHVMTYREFGGRLESPNQTFTEDIDLIFCDEIHSLPIYRTFDKSPELDRAMRWLFTKHDNKIIYYFTATQEKLENVESKVPGYLSEVTTFDYSKHDKIRKYVANSTYLISHIEQLRPHLQAKLEGFDYYGYKGLAFTKHIEEERKIFEIAKSEGFKPIMLWSINNKEEIMDEEQLRVREFVLKSGYIPEPYNLLIINGAMQEGWNLVDDKIRLAILDTLDLTEQIQSLGRIRKDIELLIKKTDDESLVSVDIEIPEKYIDVPLTESDRNVLAVELDIINKYGKQSKWPTIKKYAIMAGYEVKRSQITLNGNRVRVETISIPEILGK